MPSTADQRRAGAGLDHHHVDQSTRAWNLARQRGAPRATSRSRPWRKARRDLDRAMPAAGEQGVGGRHDEELATLLAAFSIPRAIGDCLLF